MQPATMQHATSNRATCNMQHGTMQHHHISVAGKHLKQAKCSSRQKDQAGKSSWQVHFTMKKTKRYNAKSTHQRRRQKTQEDKMKNQETSQTSQKFKQAK